MGCHARIDKALAGALVLPLKQCSRYVIFSDCHRGEGTINDNFLKNQHLYIAALKYYLRRRFFYLELGDGEELWENRSLDMIMDYHATIYCLLSQFQNCGQFAKIYGNHDIELRTVLPEAIILENQEGGRDMCMVHGHQADFFNSVCWRISRFLVRYLWKPLENSGFNDPTSAARNYKKAVRYEKCMESWTKEHDLYLVAGHSHRPRLPERGNHYINTGSCVHPSGITCIEIENMNMTLIRWAVWTRTDLSLYVKREMLSGPVPIE